MIDAQHAGVAHVRGGDSAQVRPAAARGGERIGRRQVPVLALGRERIGRRADRHALSELACVRPGLRPVGRRADCEIAIEADLEARRAGASRSSFQLAVREPLAKEREVERLGVGGDRGLDRPGLAITQQRGPRPPSRTVRAGGDRLERGEAPQGVAPRADERLVVQDERVSGPGGADPGERRVKAGQRDALDRPHRRVVDVSGRRGRDDLRSESASAASSASSRGRLESRTSMRIGSRKRRSDG